MPAYVILVQWTEQGVRSYRETVERSEAVAQLTERMGGRVKDLYWTLGGYDLVAIVEAPDDETITALALQICGQGNVRTTTMRAFDADEMRQIIAKAG